MINFQFPQGRRLFAVRILCGFIILLISMASGAMTVAAEEPLLAVEIRTDLSEAGPNEQLTFTVTVTNLREEQVDGIEVIVRYDETLIEQVSGAGGELNEAGEFVWIIPSLAGGEQLPFTLTATVKDTLPYGSSVLNLKVDLQHEEKNVASSKLTGLTLKGAILQVEEVKVGVAAEAIDNDKINPGDTVGIVIQYSNTGLGPSRELTLTSYYPLDLVAKIVNNANDGQVDEDAGTITWMLPSIGAGARGQVEINLILLGNEEFPPGVTSFSLRADIRSGEDKGNEVTVTVPVTVANLVRELVCPLTLDADGDQLGDPEDKVECKFTLQNQGNTKTEAVKVVVAYDADSLQVSEISVPDDQRYNHTDGTLTLENLVIEVGKELELTFTGTILVPPKGQADIPITVTVEHAGGAPIVTRKGIPLPEEEEPSIIEILQPQQGTGALDGKAQKTLLLSFLGLILAGMAGFLFLGISAQRSEKPFGMKMGMVLEVFLLALTLFVVMFLGLQNVIDKEAINSIIGGIVGFVAGRAISGRDNGE